jgi:CheY-like chemotaxis protein
MKRIAVVEDNPDNRLLVEAILMDSYEIVEYETGPEALAGLKQDRPDLVLLDISLPGMNGEDVLKELRSWTEFSDLPVIALTAHAMAGDRKRFLELGFNAYVSKPIVDETVLLNAIAELLPNADTG